MARPMPREAPVTAIRRPERSAKLIGASEEGVGVTLCSLRKGICSNDLQFFQAQRNLPPTREDSSKS
jgi:hypothetical protein